MPWTLPEEETSSVCWSKSLKKDDDFLTDAVAFELLNAGVWSENCQHREVSNNPKAWHAYTSQAISTDGHDACGDIDLGGSGVTSTGALAAPAILAAKPTGLWSVCGGWYLQPGFHDMKELKVWHFARRYRLRTILSLDNRKWRALDHYGCFSTW